MSSMLSAPAIIPAARREGPAVALLQFRQQAVHHVPAGHAGLPPGETRRAPCHQVIKQAGVRGIVYAGVNGCCAIVLFHKLA
jgi:hypothetical protein